MWNRNDTSTSGERERCSTSSIFAGGARSWSVAAATGAPAAAARRSIERRPVQLAIFASFDRVTMMRPASLKYLAASWRRSSEVKDAYERYSSFERLGRAIVLDEGREDLPIESELSIWAVSA
jgi:hypothetical protein